jgi:transposase-like protein
MQTEYLDEALSDFSGYLAVDEVYDGPFCILSAVDNHKFNRLSFRVLDHDATHEDVRSFLAQLKAELDKRSLSVKGITTDGSSLYPTPLAELWPGVPHQLCCFHIIRDITKAVLHAVAKLRKELAAEIPVRKRGRPSMKDKDDRAKARQITRQKERVAELFEHRYVFVRRHLSASQKKLLQRLTRGQPLLRTLRGIMDEVYRLFDRRCKMATALKKLAKLQARVKRFKRLGKTLATLQSPNLEKALVFLDDRQLPSTSNAVERSNRRFRKAQKSIDSVRTQPHLEQRIALDMFRELWASRRMQAIKALHVARAKGLAPTMDDALFMLQCLFRHCSKEGVWS